MKNISTFIVTKLGFLLVSLFIFNISKAQDGVSSGSVSHTMSNGFYSTNERGFINENTIIIEDFMNYHKHKIEIPKKNEVAVSIDYNNRILNSKDHFLVQIGVATKNVNFKEKSNNVNVSLVIDNSGSMAGGKLEKVKNAVKVFVKGLKDEDIISIIKFDGNANIVLNATKIKNLPKDFNRMIDDINPEGSTNIHDGMMMGYKEAEKNNTKNLNSKVILLTDGMTNSGITDPEIILKNSKEFNDKGIDISTIGVGQQLDFTLLKNIANAGRGSNYFIGVDEKDIQKTFKDELESLLYNIGKKAKITINLPKGMKVHQFYGYQPKYISDNIIEVELENLDCGQTQIFLIEVDKNNSKNTEIAAIVSYEKNDDKKIANAKKTIDSSIDNTESELIKNYQIAKMTSELKQAAKDFVETNIGNAEKNIQKILDYYDVSCVKNDEDINRIYNIALQYSPQKYPRFYK